MCSVIELGFDAPLESTTLFRRFRGEERNATYRIALPMAKKKDSIIGAKCHWHHPKYFVCKSGVCCEKLQKPRWRFGTVVIQYHKHVEYEVMIWFFGQKVYEALKHINQEFPLDEHDIAATCVHELYQQFNFMPIHELIWKHWPAERIKIMKNEIEKAHVFASKFLAVDYNEEEIKKLLAYVSTKPKEETTKAAEPISMPLDTKVAPIPSEGIRIERRKIRW